MQVNEAKTRLQQLPDDQLLEALQALVRRRRCVDAELVVHLAEIDARRLYLAKACPSMYAYCWKVLGMDEGAAYRRIRAARASREFPVLVEWLADGRLHLAGITLLVPHLTVENQEELLAAAAGKSKKQIEDLLAARFPEADVPDSIRVLPRKKDDSDASGDLFGQVDSKRDPAEPKATGLAGSQTGGGDRPSAIASVTPSATQSVTTTPSASPLVSSPATSPSEASAAPACETVGNPAPEKGASGATVPASSPTSSPAFVRPSKRAAAVIEPLSAERVRVQFTADRAFREKLHRVQALARRRIPNGDLAAVFDLAFTLALETLEKKRFACLASETRTERRSSNPATAPDASGSERASGVASTEKNRAPTPRGQRRGPRSRHIPNAIKREVYQRDEGRCTFIGEGGVRCQETDDLEFHHRDPFGRGGAHSAENVAMACPPHNQYMARLDFGSDHIDARIRERRKGSPNSDPPSVNSPRGEFAGEIAGAVHEEPEQ